MHLLLLMLSFSLAAADGGAADAGTGPAAEDDGVAAAAPALSTVHLRCPKTCVLYFDGLRQMKMSPDKKSVLIENVAPGTHQVVGKDMLNALIGSGMIEVAPASEVFVQLGSGKASVTVTKPIH